MILHTYCKVYIFMLHNPNHTERFWNNSHFMLVWFLLLRFLYWSHVSGKDVGLEFQLNPGSCFYESAEGESWSVHRTAGKQDAVRVTTPPFSLNRTHTHTQQDFHQVSILCVFHTHFPFCSENSQQLRLPLHDNSSGIASLPATRVVWQRRCGLLRARWPDPVGTDRTNRSGKRDDTQQEAERWSVSTRWFVVRIFASGAHFLPALVEALLRYYPRTITLSPCCHSNAGTASQSGLNPYQTIFRERKQDDSCQKKKKPFQCSENCG